MSYGYQWYNVANDMCYNITYLVESDIWVVSSILPNNGYWPRDKHR